MCLSETRCFSFRFDESSSRCTLMEKEGLCINRPTYTGPIYTDVYVDDSEPTTFPECKLYFGKIEKWEHKKNV